MIDLCPTYTQARNLVAGKNTEQLIELLDNEEVLVQCCAIRELQTRRATLAVPHLIQMVWRTKCPGVRKALAEALGTLGDPQAVPALVEILKSDIHNRHARAAAAEALGKLGDPQAVPALIDALVSHRGWQDEGVPEAAARALGKLRDPSAVPVLIQAVRKETPSVQIAACEALGEMGVPEAVPTLIQAYWDGGKVREVAEKILLQLPPSAFVVALKQPCAYTRAAACEFLARGKSRDAIPILTTVVANDSSWQVRRAAAEALAEIFNA